YMPSPLDIPSIDGQDVKTGEPMYRKAADDEPFSGLAFKIMNDPYVGQLTFVRVYSGVLRSGESVINVTKGKKERIGRLLLMHTNKSNRIKEYFAANHRVEVG